MHGALEGMQIAEYPASVFVWFVNAQQNICTVYESLNYALSTTTRDLKERLSNLMDAVFQHMIQTSRARVLILIRWYIGMYTSSQTIRDVS